MKNQIKLANGNACDLVVIQTDFSSAFDTIDDDFILECLKFWNFPIEFVSHMRTVIYDRKGRIIGEEGEYGEFFEIKRGVQQGAFHSAYIFICMLVILLMKIENDEEIVGLKNPYALGKEEQVRLGELIITCETDKYANTFNNSLKEYIIESQQVNSKVESYADDCSFLLDISRTNLDKFVKHFEDFYKMSGLQLNKKNQV